MKYCYLETPELPGHRSDGIAPDHGFLRSRLELLGVQLSAFKKEARLKSLSELPYPEGPLRCDAKWSTVYGMQG